MTQRDEGFTLVELLLAISIMLVIIVPLASSFILGIGTANGGLQDTTNTVDAQILAGFFDTDVASAETASTSSSCGTSGTAVLGLLWHDGTKVVTVAYRAVADAAKQAELNVTTPIDRLERVRCVDGVTADTTAVGRSVLHSPGAQLTCDGGACASTTPRDITLTVIEQTPQLADKNASGQYTIAVTGTRRVTP